jgi:hypothetical protein
MSSWVLDGFIGYERAAQSHENMPMSQSRRCILPQSFKNGFTGCRSPIRRTPAFLHLGRILTPDDYLFQSANRLHSRYNFLTLGCSGLSVLSFGLMLWFVVSE